jgi:hypothetical protein
MEWYEDGGGAVAQLSWMSPFLPRTIIPNGALQPPMRAGVPSPGNGEVDVPPTVILNWLAGEGAAEHVLYFGDDAEAVAGATEPTARQTAGVTSYNAGALEWGKTYYWRVDEVLSDGTVLAGKVWSFITANFLMLDDFESYTNEVGQRVFEVWIDGIGFTLPEPGNPGNGTGAAVGHDIWSPGSPHFGGDLMETSIVHGGNQSMPVSYDNSSAPGISEADRNFSPPENWASQGLTTLVVYFHGEPDNTGQPYLKINGIRAPDNGNVPDVTAATWASWTVDLASVGVNLTSVTQLSIGVEGGGAGTFYIDDVQLKR